MIRSPERIATAIRLPDGSVSVRTDAYVSLSRRVRVLRVPIVRGLVAFVETLVIGVETLNHSASVLARAERQSAEHADTSGDWRERLANWAGMAFAFAAAGGVFFFLPLAVSSLARLNARAFAFNLVAGTTRAALLLLYLWTIGRIREVERVFGYHGAEHQTIFAYEAGEELSVEAARGYPRFHPRCGTSFLLIVVLLAVLTYALVDSAFIALVARPETLVERFAVHLAFLPIVAGVAFEALKLSGEYRSSPAVRALVAPGLWIQRLTTRQPGAEQLAVAVAAARASLGLPHDGAVVTPHTVEAGR
jgi:uncharacterized protein YqhQ